MPIPKDLLDIMACAFCKAELRLDGEKLRCVNAECGLVYSIKDDIPIMLIDEAERPCPKCSATREWNDDILRCAKCGATLKYERRPSAPAEGGKK
jgi:uncharacterized protein YbaR (Trm112 family)